MVTGRAMWPSNVSSRIAAPQRGQFMIASARLYRNAGTGAWRREAPARIEPSTWGKKLRIYAREGVHHLWLVNPTTETLEAYRLEEGRWVLVVTHSGDVLARIEPFDAIEIVVNPIEIPGAFAKPEESGRRLRCGRRRGSIRPRQRGRLLAAALIALPLDRARSPAPGIRASASRARHRS
jgi:hypothetical protein